MGCTFLAGGKDGPDGHFVSEKYNILHRICQHICSLNIFKIDINYARREHHMKQCYLIQFVKPLHCDAAKHQHANNMYVYKIVYCIEYIQNKKA
jgi:hypothetical protein